MRSASKTARRLMATKRVFVTGEFEPEEAIPLINIVRKPEQAELLRGIGAKYVCDTSTPSFMAELTEALKETGATMAFDAIGGGRLANQLLVAMEAAE